MVHYSDRRMRLAGEEVAPIMELVRLRLHELVETHVENESNFKNENAFVAPDLELAELLFRPLWRFHYPYPGRPSYPEPVTWSIIEELLRNGPLSGSGDEPTEAEMMNRFEAEKEAEPTVSDEEADAQFEVDQEAEEEGLRGEAEAQEEAEAREDEERAREEEQEQWSTDPEGEPEA